MNAPVLAGESNSAALFAIFVAAVLCVVATQDRLRFDIDGDRLQARVVDDRDKNYFPMPLEASGQDDVLVGRIRKDTSCAGGLAFWTITDSIRKGAASAVKAHVEQVGASFPTAIQTLVDEVARRGSTPLVVRTPVGTSCSRRTTSAWRSSRQRAQRKRGRKGAAARQRGEGAGSS